MSEDSRKYLMSNVIKCINNSLIYLHGITLTNEESKKIKEHFGKMSRLMIAGFVVKK